MGRGLRTARNFGQFFVSPRCKRLVGASPRFSLPCETFDCRGLSALRIAAKLPAVQGEKVSRRRQRELDWLDRPIGGVPLGTGLQLGNAIKPNR